MSRLYNSYNKSGGAPYRNLIKKIRSQDAKIQELNAEKAVRRRKANRAKGIYDI